MGEGRRRRAWGYVRDPPLPAVFTRDVAREAGMTDRQIDRRLFSGVWTAERRGLLRVAESPDRASPSTDVEAAVLAAAGAARRREFVVSHTSAARLYSLPAPIGGWGKPTLTATGGTARRAGLHVRVVPLDDDEVATVGALTVTNLARTVVDCLRSLAPRDGLAIADAALRAGLSSGEIDGQLRRQSGWPGVVQARELAELADGRRESPLESWSALAFHRWGLARPEWQIDIRTDREVFCGRVDTWWSEGIAGEADGRAKYALAAAQQQGAEVAGLLDALGNERERETSIRRTKAEVVRWGPKDVLNPRRTDDLCRHIRWHQTRLRNTRPFTGTATPAPTPAPTPAQPPPCAW